MSLYASILALSITDSRFNTITTWSENTVNINKKLSQDNDKENAAADVAAPIDGASSGLYNWAVYKFYIKMEAYN